MLRSVLKSKIHGAIVTETNIDYCGSITIDSALLDATDIIPYEMVQVVNLNNGSRLETYVIPGKKGSGVIGMNGGAARHAIKGDRVLIMAYGLMETKDARSHSPKIVLLDGKNRVREKK